VHGTQTAAWEATVSATWVGARGREIMPVSVFYSAEGGRAGQESATDKHRAQIW